MINWIIRWSWVLNSAGMTWFCMYSVNSEIQRNLTLSILTCLSIGHFLLITPLHYDLVDKKISGKKILFTLLVLHLACAWALLLLIGDKEISDLLAFIIILSTSLAIKSILDMQILFIPNQNKTLVTLRDKILKPGRKELPLKDLFFIEVIKECEQYELPILKDLDNELGGTFLLISEVEHDLKFLSKMRKIEFEKMEKIIDDIIMKKLLIKRKRAMTAKNFKPFVFIENTLDFGMIRVFCKKIENEY